MNTRTYTISFLIAVVILCSLLPTGAAHAAPAQVSLIYGEIKPQELIGVADARVTAVGKIWRGNADTALFTETFAPTPLAALMVVGSHFEVTCNEFTTTVGIQFLGDANDGWARISVDNHPQSSEVFIGGGTLANDKYVELANLPLGQQTIRVEAISAPDTDKFGHVTVVAFGCGELLPTGGQAVVTDGRLLPAAGQSQENLTIYLPLVSA